MPRAPANFSCLCPESQPTTSDETVVAGGTVVLKCQVEDPDDSSLQWSNPAQQTLYFGEKRGTCAGTGDGRGLPGERSQLQDQSNGKAKWTRAGVAPEGDAPSCSPPTVIPPGTI